MDKVPYHNTTDTPRYVGGVLVEAGQTRMVPAMAVNPPAAAAPAAPAADGHDDALLALLDGNTAEITEALPGLDAAQLDALELAEANGKTRKGVLAAIAAARAALEMDGANLGDDESAAD